MGLNITNTLLQKTRWVASKLSLRRWQFKKRSRMETTQLRPIALAGASRCFTGSSTQCNHFSRTPSGAQYEQGKYRWRRLQCRGQHVEDLPNVRAQVLTLEYESTVSELLFIGLQVSLYARS
ncbi:unnamed protein product [Peronospora effusa]|nr:unnamed protein product [Peronospora effusa]